MARTMDEKHVTFYRVISTVHMRWNDTEHRSIQGPYTTISAAKGQAGGNGYNKLIEAKIQRLGIAIDDYPDDIVAKLAWEDVATNDGTGWVNVEEQKNA